MVNKKIVGIGIVAVVAVAAIVVVVMLPQGTDTAPVIWDPIAPVSPRAGQNISISIGVTDDKGISSAILSWSNNSGATWQNVTMTRTSSETTQWFGTANIPPQDIEATVQYKIYAQDTADQWAVKDNAYSLYTGTRKAIILNSDDRFYNSSSNDNFNNGQDSSFFAMSEGNWSEELVPNTRVGVTTTGGVGGSNCIYLACDAAGDVSGNWTLDYDEFYGSLPELGFFNLSAQVKVPYDPILYGGARLGLRWKNTTGIVRVDWSESYEFLLNFMEINCLGLCTNQTGQEVTDLDLILAINGTAATGSECAFFDEIKVSHWISVNLTTSDPAGGNPPPTGADAFPAQALQVYKTLKYHEYADPNILLMLYNVNNPVVDITAGDGLTNDVEGAAVDIANASITATKFKQELNVSFPGSFASEIQPNDQLIIFMTDHGSNKWIGDGNTTFHFATGGQITEFEFYDLVKNITCWRMLINVDCCFSGNFLQNCSIGPTWHDLPNAILVSAASNVASWYWKNCNNADGFAGSWMFHPFWDQLNASQTIDTAFTFALNFLPTMVPPAGKVVGAIQTPLMQDNLGIKTTWSFSSFPKL